MKSWGEGKGTFWKRFLSLPPSPPIPFLQNFLVWGMGGIGYLKVFLWQGFRFGYMLEGGLLLKEKDSYAGEFLCIGIVGLLSG